MYKTPPADHEQQAYSHPNYPRQRRKAATMPRQPQSRYLTDETPEIPKIRRASLYPDQRKAQPEKEIHQSEHKPVGRVPARDIPYQRTSQNHQRVPASESIPSRGRPPGPPPTHTQSRRSYGYLPAQLHSLGRKQPIFIICTFLGIFLLAVLIIAPLIAQTLRSQTTINVSDVGNGQPSNGPPSGVQPLTNPHELIITPQDSDHPAPPVFATAAYLLDADTGATLYARNPFIHLSGLSTAKLMTALLAVEQGNPDQKITITAAMDHDINQLSGDSSLFGVKKGETYTLRELLYGLLLPSGNDAALIIADTIGGSTSHFVAEMNQRAHQLGLYDTHYMNPHGLLATGQFSSAHDLAVLGKYTMSVPLIHQISGTEQYHIPQGGNHSERFVINGNQFLWWYPGVDGGKTGHAPSDYIQVVSATRNHHHLIGVTIHTVDWWTDMRNLMNWGFNSFKWISPYDVDLQHPIPYDYLWNYFTDDKKDNTIRTSDQGRYYLYTGFSISGPVLTYFDSGGGLQKFGYPQGMPTISSALVVSQSFEHGKIQCDLTTKQCNTV